MTMIDFFYSLTACYLLCISILMIKRKMRRKKHLPFQIILIFDYLEYLKEAIDDVLNFADFSIEKNKKNHYVDISFEIRTTKTSNMINMTRTHTDRMNKTYMLCFFTK
jgi:hypothetical protein